MATLRFKTNLNCGNCVAAVKPQLDAYPAIKHWSVNTTDPNKILTVEGTEIASEAVERLVNNAGFRILGTLPKLNDVAPPAEEKSFAETYRPLLLVFAFLTGLVAIAEIREGGFNWMRSMTNFMGGFFIAFSFFKLLDVQGFAQAFQTYDVVAQRNRAYGYFYPFIELALGVAYLLNLAPLFTNVVTLVVMLVGIIGVTQALLQKRRIQCACLGSVFNLPMSKVTFVEDALMAGMAAAMIVMILV